MPGDTLERAARHPPESKIMFSHIVISWTNAGRPQATQELIEGARQYLKSIPGVVDFHVGFMAPFNLMASRSSTTARLIGNRSTDGV